MGNVSKLLLLCLFGLLIAQPTMAETMGTGSHNLRINSAAFSDEQPTPEPEIVTKPQVEKPFVVTHDSDPLTPTGFGLTIATTLIDFGELTPSNPITRAISFQLSNTTPLRVSLFGQEDHILLVPEGMSIPDTTCDNGSCSEATAAQWSSELTYGFGYRCENGDGVGCNDSFAEPTNYKQFADLSAKEDYAFITQAPERQSNLAKQLRLQINTAGSQAKGAYSSSVTLLLVPNL